jgi:hypothetical protein
MRKIELKSRKFLRQAFNCFSLTAVAFIFQACYGMENCSYYDVKLTGTVTSKTTNLPIKGIKVFVNEGVSHGFTDKDGKFSFYASVPSCEYYTRDSVLYTPDKMNISFLDIDGIENGHFADSTIVITPARKDEVRINIALREIK